MKFTYVLLIVLMIFLACSSSDDSDDNSECEKYVAGFHRGGQDNYILKLLNKELWDLVYACQEFCSQEIADRVANEHEIVNVDFNTYSYYVEQSPCTGLSCSHSSTEICWEGVQ